MRSHEIDARAASTFEELKEVVINMGEEIDEMLAYESRWKDE